MTRVTKGNNGITQKYSLTHRAVDIGWHNKESDNIVTAHSSGKVVGVVKNYNKTDKSGNSYGNYIKIQHDNGYYTLYAHLKYGSVCVTKGERVLKGQQIAVIGNTGYCGKQGARHLHFEVRNPKDTRINPTTYINADLPNTFTKGYYTTLKSKYIRTSPQVINGDKPNKIYYDRITKKVTKDKCYADKDGYARTKVGVKFQLNEFTTDSKGNIWGKLEWDWICVQDSTGKQVKAT
jgi:hypothetical protein